MLPRCLTRVGIPLACSALLIAGVTARAARADDVDPAAAGDGVFTSDRPSAADKETARTLFRQGDERFRAKDFQGAYKAFRAADEIMGVPTTGLEHARSLMMLGRLLEARDLCIQVTNREVQDEELSAQQDARAEAQQLAAALVERIPAIQVTWTDASPGADVTLRIDDVTIPASAVEFARKVDPGAHVVQVFVAGFKPVTRKVTVREGEELAVAIELEASDGDAADPWGGEVTDESPSALPTLSWIGFAVGLVGLSVAVPTGIYALAERSRLDDLCVDKLCPPELQGDLDTALVVAHVSTAGFVVAGVGVAVGVSGLLLRQSLPDALAGRDAPFTLEPFVGLGAAGVSGTF